MNKKLNNSVTESLGAVLALGLAASTAHAFALTHEPPTRNMLGQGSGGLLTDDSGIGGSPIAHTDQGPVKAGGGPFGTAVYAPPSDSGSHTQGPSLSSGLGFDSDLLSLDAATPLPPVRIPAVGPITLFDLEEFNAIQPVYATDSAPLVGSLGTHAVPAPGSLVLIGVAGSIVGLRRKRVR